QTQPGRIMGTPLYMAPEQGSGGQVDHRTDLYAAGLILYEMVTGEPPFKGETMTELFVKQATATIPSIHEAHPNLHVPGILDEVLAIALAKKPEDRFQSASELLEALEAVDQGEDSSASLRRSGRLRRSSARRRPPADESSEVREHGGRTARKRTLITLAAIVVVAGLAWQFTGSAAGGPAVPRVSMKAPERRTESETRYVTLLEEARRSVRSGAADEAFAKVEEARSMECRDSEAFLVRALVYRERDDDDTAIADFQAALVEDPAYAAAAAGIGWIRLDRDDLDGALESFDEAAQLDERCAEAIAGRGAVRYLRGEREAAVALLANANEIDADCAEASYYLGLAHLDGDDVDGAIRALVQAKRSDPRSGRVYAALGEAYLRQARAGDAEKQFREAVSLEPDAAEPLVNLAALLIDGERTMEAVSLLEEPLQRHPDWGRLQVLQGSALEAQGRTNDAIAMLEKGLQTVDEDPEALTLLGLLYQREGRQRDAIAQYEAAIEAGGDPSVPRLNMGLALFALEQFEGARVQFETALTFDSGLPMAHYALGLLHMDYLGGEAAALEHFTAYRSLGGDDDRVEEWMAGLSQE
ncbi:MAG: tetratricopeptide repeat protein, partial [Planctomycetota bacterium]